MAHGGSSKGLTCFTLERERRSREKRVFPLLNLIDRLARAIREYFRSRRAMRAIYICKIKSSLISSGHNLDSLYKTEVYVVL
jgi:hypothetical protein